LGDNCLLRSVCSLVKLLRTHNMDLDIGCVMRTICSCCRLASSDQEGIAKTVAYEGTAKVTVPENFFKFFFTHPVGYRSLVVPFVQWYIRRGSLWSLDMLDNQGSSLGRRNWFFSSPHVQTVCGSHPAYYPMCTGGLIPGLKRPECESRIHLAQRSRMVELYTSSPHMIRFPKRGPRFTVSNMPSVKVKAY
jgi:hypothetical protein